MFPSMYVYVLLLVPAADLVADLRSDVSVATALVAAQMCSFFLSLIGGDSGWPWW
jgi:hypothetical protein